MLIEVLIYFGGILTSFLGNLLWHLVGNLRMKAPYYKVSSSGRGFTKVEAIINRSTDVEDILKTIIREPTIESKIVGQYETKKSAEKFSEYIESKTDKPQTYKDEKELWEMDIPCRIFSS